MKRRLFFISLLVVSLSLSIGIPLAARNSQSQEIATRPTPVVEGMQLSGIANQCLEQNGKQFELVGTAEENGKTFHYLHIWIYDTNEDFESYYSLIQTDKSGRCQLLRGVKSGLKPLSSFMSIALARSLELKRYQREIDRAGGRTAFERQLRRRLQPSPHSAYYGEKIYLSEEQVWALHQLNLQFPNTYQLVRKGETVKP